MKHTIKPIYFAMIAGALCTFAGCNNEDEPTVYEKIKLDKNSIVSLYNESLSHEVKFVSQGEWRSFSNAGWIKVTPGNSVADSACIQIDIEENLDFTSRSGYVVVKDLLSSYSDTVRITQGAAQADLSFNKEVAELKRNEFGLADTIEVISNYKWVPEIANDWLRYEVVKSVTQNNITTTTLAFDVDTKRIRPEEQTVEVNFKDLTNAGKTASLKVEYPGFTPRISFNAYNNELYFFENVEEIFMARLEVKSNIEWSISDRSEWPAFVESIEFSGDKQKPVNFFETENILMFRFNDAYADTEMLEALVEFIDTKFGQANQSVKLIYEGLGTDYVWFDRMPFKGNGMDDNDGFLFSAAEWDMNTGEQIPGAKMSQLFEVKSGKKIEGWNTAKWPLAFFCVEAPGFWPANKEIFWANVEEPAYQAKSLIDRKMMEVWVRPRSDEEEFMGMDPYENRYFAMFVVPRTSEEMSVDDLFDGEMLKMEYMNSFQIIGQKGLTPTLGFESPDIANGAEIDVDPAGGNFTINFTYSAPKGFSIYTNIKETPEGAYGDPWMENDPIIKDTDFGYNEEEGTSSITFTIKPNTTGKPRSEEYGFITFLNDNDEKGYLLVKFILKQAAK